jgi:membrane protease YdiL (CAAX protease family)
VEPLTLARMVWRVFLTLIFVLAFVGLSVTILISLPPLYGLLWSLSLGAAFLWWHRHPDRRARVRMGRPHGPPRRMVLAGAATVLIVIGVTGLVELLISPLDDVELGPWEHILAYMDTLWGWIAMTTFVALVVPIVEEFCFRGHIQHTLESRYAPWVAILITTALFTAGHVSPAHSSLLLVPLILSLGMGVATVLFRSIWVAVAIHAFWNGVLSFQSVVLADSPPELPGQDPLLPLSLLLLALGLAGWARVLGDGRYRALLRR